MLIIRDAQIRALIAANEDELRKAVMDAIRTANPNRVADYSDEKLGAMCDVAISRAEDHELTKPEDVAAFAAVMFEISPRFYEHPEVKAVLQDGNFPPSDRFYQLFERVSEAGWAVAEWSYDESGWFAPDDERPDISKIETEGEFLELNYSELANKQKAIVEELKAKLAEAPSEARNADLDRQLDRLRFLENAYQWEPRERAKRAALSAKESVLRRAVI